MNKCADTPYRNSDGRIETDGLEGPHNIHAEGSDLLEHETLCGHVGTRIKWRYTKSPVTCSGCLDVIALVHRDHPRRLKS